LTAIPVNDILLLTFCLPAQVNMKLTKRTIDAIKPDSMDRVLWDDE
jgi:hypothetical protein